MKEIFMAHYFTVALGFLSDAFSGNDGPLGSIFKLITNGEYTTMHSFIGTHGLGLMLL